MSRSIFSIILTVLMTITLPSCSRPDKTDSSSTDTSGTTTVTEPSDQDTTQPPETDDTVSSVEVQPGDSDTTRTAVYYFSGTGTTAGIARIIADTTGAELIEIVPQEPYSSDDLNYNNDNCRANQEQNDKSARPGISGTMTSPESYDTIFLGYPIWWGEEPRIIDTFLESYDFSQKTVVPFCTSGGSGIETSVRNIRDLVSIGTLADGRRFSGGASTSDVEAWLNSLDL